MRAYLKFVATGSMFATVEEFLTIVVLRRDIGSYIFTLLILFPIFLTFVWFSSRLIDRFFPTRPKQELAHFFIFGGIGLLMEWFLMGLAPWSNPAANPIAMLIFQLGMFSFWATVAFAPRLFSNPDENSQRCRREVLRFYTPYFVIVYLIAFVVAANLRFVTIILSILFGYLFLNVFYVRYFVRAVREVR